MKTKEQVNNTIKARLTILIDTVLSESSFDPTIKRIVSKMITNFLKNASDEQLQSKIENLRDEIIPFVLYGEAGDDHVGHAENTHTDG